MTVIVYDGDKTVAVDRQATRGSTKTSMQKAWVCEGKEGQYIAAVAGELSLAKGVLDWYANGADPNSDVRFEPLADEDDGIILIVVDKNGLKYYPSQHGSAALGHVESAFGNGADIACGALYMGATAREAVESACKHSIYCGMGVDVLILGRQNNETN